MTEVERAELIRSGMWKLEDELRALTGTLEQLPLPVREAAFTARGRELENIQEILKECEKVLFPQGQSSI